MRARGDTEVGVEATTRTIVAAMLDEGTPPASRVAAASSMSLRTLQRRLADEGTSFSALLDDVRRERAVAHLSAGSGSLHDLATSLGYKRQSALTRAVRRWTGCIPSHFGRGGSK
jgi:AraC-like DNA-binding protein